MTVTNVTFCHTLSHFVTFLGRMDVDVTPVNTGVTLWHQLWYTKIIFLSCNVICHILRTEKEKRRISLLACCQLPSPPRRQLHVEVGTRPHLLSSGLGVRQRDPVMDLPCPSPRKPRPSRSQRHVRQRQHLLLPPLSNQCSSSSSFLATPE